MWTWDPAGPCGVFGRSETGGKATMGIEETPDLQRMLRRCYTQFLTLRKPGSRMTKLMNLAIVVGDDIGNLQSTCSQGVVAQYVGALIKFETLLNKVREGMDVWMDSLIVCLFVHYINYLYSSIGSQGGASTWEMRITKGN